MRDWGAYSIDEAISLEVSYRINTLSPADLQKFAYRCAAIASGNSGLSPIEAMALALFLGTETITSVDK